MRFLFVVLIALVGINTALKTRLKSPYEGPRLTFVGVVVGEDHYENYIKLSINIQKILLKQDTITYHIPVTFYTTRIETYLGKTLLIKGKITISKFPDRPNILAGDIIGSHPPKNVFNKIFYSVRNYIDTFLKGNLKNEHYNVASGLILGGSSRVGKDLREVFSRAGVLHILAVSGLHVGFVCFFVGFILLFVPVSTKIKFTVVMLVLFLYAGITGFRPSVCRASVMAFLFGLAIILQRNVTSMHFVNITAIMLLFINPLLLFNVGAQLSFAAVYGILFMYPRIDITLIKKVKRRFLKLILTPMAISFSAQAFVSPLLIYYFHRLPTLAVMTNVLIVPIASITIFLLFLSLLIGLFLMPLAKLIAIAISLLLTALITISKMVAHLPFSTVSLTMSPIILLFIYFIYPHRMRKTAMWGILAIVTIFSIASLSHCVSMRIAPTGALISTPGGDDIFIALKHAPTRNARFLTNQGIDEIDYLIAPSKIYPTKKDFFELPENFNFKRITLDDLIITLDEDVAIRYHGQEIELNEENLRKPSEEGNVLYIITDGRDIQQFTTVLHGSIIDQILVDMKVVFTKLRFLF